MDEVLEASAVEPVGDGSLVLVAHDKAEPLVLAEADTGRIVAEGITTPAFPTGLAVGPKWEGMARDDQGNLYVIGSHSGKTDDERTQRSYLVRFRLKGDGPKVAIDAGFDDPLGLPGAGRSARLGGRRPEAREEAQN